MTNDRGSAQEGKADYDADLYGASATGYVTSIPMDDEEEQDERERLVARCAGMGAGEARNALQSK